MLPGMITRDPSWHRKPEQAKTVKPPGLAAASVAQPCTDNAECVADMYKLRGLLSGLRRDYLLPQDALAHLREASDCVDKALACVLRAMAARGRAVVSAEGLPWERKAIA